MAGWRLPRVDSLDTRLDNGGAEAVCKARDTGLARLGALISCPGPEDPTALGPDGLRVAFTWRGEQEGEP
jgi:hypothetical protein